jgi:uncharacterized protein (TIGR00369 family)
VSRGFFWDAVEAGRPLCPAGESLGWKVLKIDAARKSFSAEFVARPELLNPAGIVQGGFLAAMLDETLSPAVAACLQPGEFPATLEMKVSFVAPARLGTLVGEATLVSQGKHVCFVEGRLSDSEGRVVATATATALVQRPSSASAALPGVHLRG